MIADEVVVGKNEFEGEQLKTLPPRFYIRRKSCVCKDCKLHKDFAGFDIVLDQDHPDNFLKKRKNMLKKAMRQAGKTSLFVSKLKSMATSLGGKEQEAEKRKKTLKRAASDAFIQNLRAKLAAQRLSNPDYKGKPIAVEPESPRKKPPKAEIISENNTESDSSYSFNELQIESPNPRASKARMSILKGIQQTSIFDRAKLKQLTLGNVPSEGADKSESSKDTEYLRQVEHF